MLTGSCDKDRNMPTLINNHKRLQTINVTGRDLYQSLSDSISVEINQY